MIGALAGWLTSINFALATFNLVPGFPLDGGRILRSILWGATGDFARATKFASRGGQVFAYLMIFAGIWQALTGNWIGGLWIAFIGWFLMTAAQESFAQVAVRSTLLGLRAADLMTSELPIVPRDASLEEYVREMLRTGRRCHLVVDEGQLLGMMTLHAMNRFPREEWSTTSVQAAMIPSAEIQWTPPEEPALAVLERMQESDVNQMPVVVGGNVVGMIGRDSILRVIQTRMEISAQ
jgi:CBS domain-containing protein